MQVLHFRAVVGGAEIGQVGFHFGVGNGNAEAVAEFLQRFDVHFFGLVGDILAFTSGTHAVAFNGFGQNHGGAAIGIGGGFVVGGIHFMRIMAAAVQCPHFFVGHIGHHGFQLGVFAEEMLAYISAVFGFEGLVVAVNTFFHAFFKQIVAVLRQECIPAAAPNHFQYIPAGAAEVAFQLLDDFAVAAHRAV